METKKYVTYLRVSTQKQGSSGLGLEAQRNMCADFIRRNDGEQDKEFVDVESGTHRDRKGLWAAIDYCKANSLPLVIAKLDRLARDVEFVFKVANMGIEIHFTDMPVINSMILGVFASVAQYERELCSTRTKAALAEKKKQGAKLGARNENWKRSWEDRTAEERHQIGKRRGETQNARYLVKDDIVVFIEILRKVFPKACVGDDKTKWDWKAINTKAGNRDRMEQYMRDYQNLFGRFPKWDFDMGDRQLQVKLSNQIMCVRRAVMFNFNN